MPSDTTRQEIRTECKKVTTLLRIRHALTKKIDSGSETIGTAITKLDPRADREDYLRRKKRLQATIATLTDDITLSGFGQAATLAIRQQEANIDAAEAAGKRPPYGDARDMLAEIGSGLDAAIAAETKKREAVVARSPQVARNLDEIAVTIDDNSGVMLREAVADWKARLIQLQADFFDDKDVEARAAKLGEEIVAQYNTVINERARITARRRELLAQLRGAELPRDQAVDAEARLLQVEQLTNVNDFEGADGQLGVVADMLEAVHAPPAPEAPTLAGVGNLWKLSLAPVALCTCEGGAGRCTAPSAVATTAPSRPRPGTRSLPGVSIGVLSYRTSGTLAPTQRRLAIRSMAVTRNTHRRPRVAAIAPPERGPSDWPRNIADAVTP